uniref:Uncharacterized protein n=1 Tax=Panagrolaimus sp. ES5 TaxID=591445 RepID=A0AC34G1H7_9BILA
MCAEEDVEERSICDPECSYGYNCENKNGTKKCIFSTTLIIIIVIISIIGVCVIAAGIFFICLCYCAAFNQERLSRFFIKPKTQSEVERDRIKYLEKIKKRPVYPANYFEEMRRSKQEERGGGGGSNTGSNGWTGSSGNEITFPQRQKPPKILGEKSKKSIFEIFPPATVTTPRRNSIDSNDINNNNNHQNKAPIVAVSPAPISPAARSPAAISPGRM